MTTRIGRWARRVGPALAAVAVLGGTAALPAGTASATGYGYGYVYNLAVYEASGVVTATWQATISYPTLRHPHAVHATARDGYAVSFVCSLLYAWGTPTTATVLTGQRTCSFYSLDTSRAWGVSVQAVDEDGYPVGAAETAIGSPVAGAAPSSSTHSYSIVCKRGSSIKAVTGTDPHCPAGWHRVA